MYLMPTLKHKITDMKLTISTRPVALIRASDNDHDGNELSHGQSTVLVDVTKPELKAPRRFHVMIINDDYTPMEFVIDVLEQFFSLNAEQATRVMLQVHHNGRAAVGNYSRDVAETKATLVVDYARQHQHPLLCQAEPIS